MDDSHVIELVQLQKSSFLQKAGNANSKKHIRCSSCKNVSSAATSSFRFPKPYYILSSVGCPSFFSRLSLPSLLPSERQPEQRGILGRCVPALGRTLAPLCFFFFSPTLPLHIIIQSFPLGPPATCCVCVWQCSWR